MGDKFATTPNLDAFAAKSLRYKTCWSNAPVCAPARTTLHHGDVCHIARGGAHAERGEDPGRLEDCIRRCCATPATTARTIRRRTTTSSPTAKVWDDSSNKAHWKNRLRASRSSRSSTRRSLTRARCTSGRKLVHDPAKVRVPAYQPDLPEIREDWAQYYDNVDGDGRVRRRAAQGTGGRGAGRRHDRLVLFGPRDAGCRGAKRVPFNSGLHVPFILHIPEKFKHLRPADYVPGGETRAAGQLCRLRADAAKPVWCEAAGEHAGAAVSGKYTTKPRKYLFGYRGRMDERVDVVRSVTDGRYVYVRNFMPEKPQGGYLAYMYKQAGVQAWQAAYERGSLPPEQAAFFLPKPAEALFDLRDGSRMKSRT